MESSSHEVHVKDTTVTDELHRNVTCAFMNHKCLTPRHDYSNDTAESQG
jgi:hypothetical protein